MLRMQATRDTSHRATRRCTNAQVRLGGRGSHQPTYDDLFLQRRRAGPARRRGGVEARAGVHVVRPQHERVQHTGGRVLQQHGRAAEKKKAAVPFVAAFK